jgi:gas vesicle protein
MSEQKSPERLQAEKAMDLATEAQSLDFDLTMRWVQWDNSERLQRILKKTNTRVTRRIKAWREALDKLAKP